MDPSPKSPGLFDDRIDTDTRIGNLEVFGILGRALKLLSAHRKLFGAKLLLATLALIPGLYIIWLPKIVIDQVLLQRPFDETEVPFPPHMAPFVAVVRDLAPMEIMAAVVALLIFLLFVFGKGATWVGFSQGEDSATQAENQINAGGSGAAGLVGIAETMIHTRLSQRLTNRLRTTLFERMARLPMSTLDDHRIGDAVYRVMYDAPLLPGMCYHVTLEPIFMILSSLISLYLINYSYGAVAPELVWITFSMIPVGLLITIPFSGLARRVQQDSRAAGAATTNAIEESLGNIAAVQSLGGMDRERERIDRQSRESFRRYRHIIIVEIVIGFAMLLALVAMGFYVTIFITDRIIEGIMSPGDWGVLFGLALSLGGNALGTGKLWIMVQANAAAVRRVFFFIDLPSEHRGTGLPVLDRFRHRVEIDQVDFHYGDGRPVLRDINLEFRSGELVAIVGPTGAGKTSLAYLIPGFLRPVQGRVMIDGTDIGDIDVDSLRDQVSYVFQEHVLLSESIRDNLLLVNPKASEQEMRDALDASEALTFVEALPDGIDTVLGRSGDTLSVGQKQRLCIARGLVRNTPILILDEPTAALDPHTENALVRALQKASQGRLVIVIAHRLSTIRQSDRIVFMEDGAIQDIGSHTELMANQQGRYRRFVELQGGDG